LLLLFYHLAASSFFFFFFFNDTATSEIFTLSLHDALPIYAASLVLNRSFKNWSYSLNSRYFTEEYKYLSNDLYDSSIKTSSALKDRKSTRLNSSHVKISYAVFCLKKKKKYNKYKNNSKYKS